MLARKKFYVYILLKKGGLEMKIIPGNGIARQYNNARKLRNKGWVMLSTGTLLAGVSAHQKDGFFTILLAGTTLLWGKITEGAINTMTLLKEQYKPILERAKQIKKVKS